MWYVSFVVVSDAGTMVAVLSQFLRFPSFSLSSQTRLGTAGRHYGAAAVDVCQGDWGLPHYDPQRPRGVRGPADRPGVRQQRRQSAGRGQWPAGLEDDQGWGGVMDDTNARA